MTIENDNRHPKDIQIKLSQHQAQFPLTALSSDLIERVGFYANKTESPDTRAKLYNLSGNAMEAIARWNSALGQVVWAASMSDQAEDVAIVEAMGNAAELMGALSDLSENMRVLQTRVDGVDYFAQ